MYCLDFEDLEPYTYIVLSLLGTHRRPWTPTNTQNTSRHLPSLIAIKTLSLALFNSDPILYSNIISNPYSSMKFSVAIKPSWDSFLTYSKTRCWNCCSFRSKLGRNFTKVISQQFYMNSTLRWFLHWKLYTSKFYLIRFVTLRDK